MDDDEFPNTQFPLDYVIGDAQPSQQNQQNYSNLTVPAREDTLVETDAPNATTSTSTATSPLDPSTATSRAFAALSRNREQRADQRAQQEASFNQEQIEQDPWIRELDIQSKNRLDEQRQVHYAAAVFDSGDTLVYIDFPPALQGRTILSDCDGLAYVSQTLRVHSEKLLETGSAKFAEMLNPTYQFRIQRRRKLVNKLPEGIKYVLDLTPPSEGDDLVFQMTELSLPPGIINWWQSSALESVPNWQVKGHDDICSCNNDDDITQRTTVNYYAGDMNTLSSDIEVSLPPTSNQLIELKKEKRTAAFNGPPHFNIPDYCPVRHRNGIIRLLAVIEDKKIVLDSAARVWTVLGVAKILDCPMVLQNHVATWILQGSNTTIIETLPEEALRIGFAIKSESVTEAAFSILVAELALELASDLPDPASSKLTVFGRKKSDVGDELSNMIQHAARALVERITTLMNEIKDPYLLDKWDLPTWQQLLRIEQTLNSLKHETVLDSFRRATMHLISAIRGVIPRDWRETLLTDMHEQHPLMQDIDKTRAKYTSPMDFRPYNLILSTEFCDLQKMLTPIPYIEMDNVWARWVFAGAPSDAEETLSRPIAALLYQFGEEQHTHLRRLRGRPDLECTRFITETIRIAQLDVEVQKHCRELNDTWLAWDLQLKLNNSKHLLLKLTMNEKKYLPLWAGGCDDGTGGVYEDFMPPAEMGPNGPGPAYHTGHTLPSDASSFSGSMIDGLDALSMRGSTTAASVDVHDSISTVYRPDKVIADDVSIAPSEAFSADEDVDLYNETQVEMILNAKSTEQELDEIMYGAPSDDDDSTSTVTEQEFMSGTESEDKEDTKSDAGNSESSHESFVVV